MADSAAPATIEETVEEHESHVGTYLRVFVALLIFTILEYFYAKVFADHFGILVAGLMTMALAKAGLVGAYFMHLKFEGNWVYMMLVPACILAFILTTALYPDMAIHYVTDYTRGDEVTSIAAPVAPGVGSATSPQPEAGH